MNFILLGPPGVGKGTQAENLAESCKIAHISTGDMFRDAIACDTEVGRKAQAYIAAGELVPDDVVIQIVRARLHQEDTSAGFILDGFPRTLEQAQALDELLGELDRPIAAVIDFEWDEDTLVQRLSGRRVCSRCGHSAHVVFHPPCVEGQCDRCGGPLVHREDDEPEAIRQRLVTYKQKTAAVSQYYAARGLLVVVDSHGTEKQVFARIEDALSQRIANG
ncbi:MAG: adenylate kinase [Armatimonadetes bacterium]|nr:adenylate kinase [Armatimonadota bacterium]